jgi:hypothetical protein
MDFIFIPYDLKSIFLKFKYITLKNTQHLLCAYAVKAIILTSLLSFYFGFHKNPVK